MQSIAEKIELLRLAVHGEIEDSINNALKRIHPDQQILFSNLQMRQLRGGKTIYTLPESDQVIAEINVRPASIKTVRETTSWGRPYTRQVQIPYRESILLFSPRGSLDTRLTVEHADMPEKYHEKIRILTGIKEYYSPKARAHNGRHKTNDADERQTSINRRQERAFKSEFRQVCEGDYEVFAINNKDRAPQNGNGHVVSFAMTGPVRREREFALKRLNSMDRAPTVQGDYVLNARIKKDLMHHRNGDQTVIQYAGGGYTTVRSNSDGRRLEQHTYSSEGELLKALGEAVSSGGTRKKRTFAPADHVAFERVSERVASREMLALRQLCASRVGLAAFEEGGEFSPDI